MTRPSDRFQLSEEPAPYIHTALSQARELLAEVGLSSRGIREILPFSASSDAGGPVRKSE